MAEHDLTTDDGLRRACEEAMRRETWDEDHREWIPALARTIQWVRDANEAERTSPDFQRRLWEENEVAAVGQGNISVEKALQQADFRKWLAKQSLSPLPESDAERVAALEALYQELQTRLKPYCARTPHLKVFRVLAALYPKAFTTIADKSKLKALSAEMGAERGLSPVKQHTWVLGRVETALGPVSSDLQGLATRMALPWFLYARFVQPPDEERTEETVGASGETRLVPLSAARRRRGFSSRGGGPAAILSTLEAVGEGARREELLDHLKSLYSEYKETSLPPLINALQREFGVLRFDGDRFVPTVRGEAFLESEDPMELSDWLLTRILGVDHAIVALRDEGGLSLRDLVARVKSVNPGWSTNIAPNVLVSWLRSLGVISLDDRGNATLTDEGRLWANRIHWQPESLAPEVADIEQVPSGSDLSVPLEEQSVSLPTSSQIYERVREQGHFEQDLVVQLHTGLWAHARRHFGILSGLSGSGKTLLARAYGSAIAPDAKQRHTLAVQPGWYDPGPLLGYVNPLGGDAYVKTPFLKFLLAAANDSSRPYVAVLDEMNLSHPEQYMAPLLSAMETGDRIELHSEADLFDGIPGALPYPANLVLIGTVNMDETTHGLSDKVLDRAFTIEFWEVDLDAYPRWGKRSLNSDHESRARAVLRDLINALSPARLHFGWRVVDDVLDFLARLESDETPMPIARALDAVVYAKILPKLRGDETPRFSNALKTCGEVLSQHGLEKSRAKLAELAADLEATGSARFWR